MRLTDVMSTQIVSITPETRVGDAARRMIEAETGAAMVLAEGDSVRPARSFLGNLAKMRCAIAALAAERFRKDHGRWPDSLKELTPK